MHNIAAVLIRAAFLCVIEDKGPGLLACESCVVSVLGPCCAGSPPFCCSRERAEVGVLPTSGQRRCTAGEERGAGTVGRGSQEGGSEIGEVLTGALGLHARYVYTGKKSERSLYIAERAQTMHYLTRDEMLQRSCKDRRGVCAPSQERDLRYDVAQGYLRQKGGDQVSKGSVLHRATQAPRPMVLTAMVSTKVSVLTMLTKVLVTTVSTLRRW